MLRKLTLFSLLLAFSTLPLVADEHDFYIPIAGTAGIFHTDVRLLNPTAADATVKAYFLGAGGQANSLDPLVTLNIPKMQEVAFDDVVTSLFKTTGLGAIYFVTNSLVLGTARIYAATPDGTFGQGLIAPPATNFLFNGALMHLQVNSAYRTNIGVMNGSNVNISVVWTLYDKTNRKVDQKTVLMPPYSVIQPTPITSGYFFNAESSDLSEAWVTFAANGPIGAYASIVDNRTSDGTFIPAQPLPFQQ